MTLSDIQHTDLENCLKVLRQGGIILYPTDTIWGIGCDACRSEAVKRIFTLKKRVDSKALITLVGSEGQLERTVANVPEVAWQLIEYSEKPITIVYDSAEPAARLAPELLAPDGSLGVRLCKDNFCAELCRRLGNPLVSTSANVSGQPAPDCFAAVSPAIVEGVDYVCSARRNELPGTDVASTVMRLSDGGIFKILRP